MLHYIMRHAYVQYVPGILAVVWYL